LTTRSLSYLDLSKICRKYNTPAKATEVRSTLSQTFTSSWGLSSSSLCHVIQHNCLWHTVHRQAVDHRRRIYAAVTPSRPKLSYDQRE